MTEPKYVSGGTEKRSFDEDMTLEEKIRIGLLAISAVSAAIVAAHFGHALKPPFLDELPGPGSF